MRILLFILAFALTAITSTAQTFSRSYDGVSLSQALADIAKVSDEYKINFIYDELEDFPVNCHFNQKNVIDAILSVIGHYPVKISINGQYIFVECMEKRQTKVRGKILGAKSKPLANANITIINPRTGEKISSGVSNDGGEFSIPCDSMRIRLKISYVGYKTFYKTCQAGKLGTITLQFSHQDLQNVEVIPAAHKKRIKDNPNYKKKAKKIREQIWNSSDSIFTQTCLDDSLLHYSSVTLAESFTGEYDHHHSWNPLLLFTNLFASGTNNSHTTSRQIVRRRVMLNDSAAVERYSLLDYPRDLLLDGNKNLNVVMGVRVTNPEGDICEIDTDPYTQPLLYDGEQRPKKIFIPQLCEGCIIDYFTWSEQKTSGVHPRPFFIQVADGFPVLHSQINVTIDKNFSVQYRHLGDAPRLTVNDNKDDGLCLSNHTISTGFGFKDTTMSYVVYVRDPQLHINRPLSALKQHVIENPSYDDILNTTSHLYKQMCSKDSSKEWASAYWNRTDTTIIGLKVDNLCQSSASRPVLEQHLYEMVMSDPPFHTFDKSLQTSSMVFNREYTEKLAYTFDRAGIPYRLAMSTRSDREEILDLMDEENIVWLLVNADGKCFIPFQKEEMFANMVGRKATSTDFKNTFTIQ